MFGGAGTIVLVVVMRVLMARAWREGIGLSLKRRLMLPAIALLLALVTLRNSGGHVFASSTMLPVVLLGMVLTAAAGVVRARSVDYSSVPETDSHPGGICIRARQITLAADVAAVVCSALVIFPVVLPAAGISAAAGSWTLTVAIGDIVASVLLVLRGRPASLAR
ncbi:hypothetical protein K7711_41980 [Nocardia sp. CA2R105]|uniref:hypothetical protein n=1 Tax=Nocardia coffeae TaxID=2873381 RepID=UPI001CA7B666|nr:hypothetical protein [Nocardia coffeae]MBY8863097.1 hypothetical protein [Nocardia coffeae]